MNIAHYPFCMNDLYCSLQISKQTHHKSVKAAISYAKEETALLAMIRQVRIMHPDMGARSIYLLTRPEGIGINKFETLVANNGLGINVVLG